MSKRYEIVLNDILDKISKRIYNAGDMLPTESSMLSTYGVSRITIQKAMSILVSRNIVERTAGRGTFVKDSSTEQITSNSNGVYAIVTPFQEPETLKVIRGAQKIMSENNQYLMLAFTERDSQNEPVVLDKLINDGVKGLIIYTLNSSCNEVYYGKLFRGNVPVVFIDKGITGLTTDMVLSNNNDGICQGMTHLIQMGHRNIAYVSRPIKTGTSLSERFNSYILNMREHCFPITASTVCISEPETLIDRLDATIEAAPNTTAVMCATDDVAIRVYDWASLRGLRIPEDISVCGFDDNYYSATMTPPLTTVAQNFESIGMQAAELLLNINNSYTCNKQVIYIPTELIKRNSVKNLN